MPRKFTPDEFDSRLVGRNIIRVGEYINITTKTKFKCLIDGYEWDTKPSTILEGFGCAKCSGKIKYTNESLDLKISKFNIKRLENYVNNTTKIKFCCLKCNYSWNTAPIQLIRSRNIKGCPQCNAQILNNEIIDMRLKGRLIKRIGNYINARSPILFKCLNENCNNSWLATTDNVTKKNNGCPLCSGGKSEKNIKHIIKENCKYDKFIHHKSFIFNNKKYIPDFYLEIKQIKIMIEYNGQQHYFPVRFGNISQTKAEQNFIKQKTRDEELRHICKENDIYLLEIPYYWKEDAIIEELKKLNKENFNGT